MATPLSERSSERTGGEVPPAAKFPVLVLAFTVGTWVLGFVAVVQGGAWEMIPQAHDNKLSSARA